jgi:D-alanyl-D-alanine carboxypeptidase/D-alanyl-D-alanine-endopeptidase (penicillin-binding protein 4)
MPARLSFLAASPRALRLLLPAVASITAACAPRATATPAPAPVPTPAAAPVITERMALTRAVDSLLAAPEFRNAHWGVLIVHPRTGDTLYSHNAGKLFMPASNQKIITGAAALALLGADYRYRTHFAARGPMSAGTLRGDLVVVGRGDPTVSDRMRGDAMAPLREMADSLHARGLRRITGRVVAGGDAFPDANYGFGWSWDDFDAPYSAGVDELLFNEGFSRVVVRGGARAGDAVRVARTVPSSAYPLLRLTDVQTLPAGADDRVRAAFDVPSGAYVLTGGVAAGDSVVLSLAHRDAQRAYLAAATEALAARGIVVEQRATSASARVRKDDPATDALALDTLYTMVSPPLRETLRALEKPSQNQIAEVLLKTLGLERAGVGSADSGRRVVERQLSAWGVDPSSVAVRDGSGLSRHNYVSPAALARVLDAIRADTAFGAFYDALPIAGVDGTIGSRMRGTPAAGNLHAKTGTIDKARSLSGYVTTADGELLIFSFLANNFTVPNREVERVQDAIGARLAGMRLGAPTASR